MLFKDGQIFYRKMNKYSDSYFIGIVKVTGESYNLKCIKSKGRLREGLFYGMNKEILYDDIILGTVYKHENNIFNSGD